MSAKPLQAQHGPAISALSRPVDPTAVEAYLPLAAVLALSLVTRLAWVLLVPNEQYSDSVWYDSATRHLVASGEYGSWHGKCVVSAGLPVPSCSDL